MRGWGDKVRIRNLLQNNTKVTPATMSQIQGDTRSQFAPILVKALLNVNLGSDNFTRQAQDLLRDWDFTSPAGGDSPGSSALVGTKSTSRAALSCWPV